MRHFARENTRGLDRPRGASRGKVLGGWTGHEALRAGICSGIGLHGFVERRFARGCARRLDSKPLSAPIIMGEECSVAEALRSVIITIPFVLELP